MAHIYEWVQFEFVLFDIRLYWIKVDCWALDEDWAQIYLDKNNDTTGTTRLSSLEVQSGIMR